MEPNMESCLSQVLQKDMGRRLQVGQEIIDYILDKEKSHDLEQDQTALDKMVDGIASSWVNSSNFKVNSTDEAVHNRDYGTVSNCGQVSKHLHAHWFKALLLPNSFRIPQLVEVLFCL